MDLTASVIVTARGEPPDRLGRLVTAVGKQQVDTGLELVLALDPAEAALGCALEPSGSIARIVVVENPGGARSGGLNRAAAAASCDVVCRFDARSQPAPDHVRRCLTRFAAEPRVGVVGGTQRPVPANGSATARGIARALANPWLLGAPAYRRIGRSGPVDTVYLGSFRRRELLELGGFDEQLDANEDFELAQRYRAAGRLVWLEAGLDVGYEARDSIPKLFGQYVAFGRSKTKYWQLKRRRPNARQLIALGLAGTISALTMASLWRPRRLLAFALAVVGGTAALDHVADPSERSAQVRVASLVASWAVVGGWLGGVVGEAVSGCRRRTARAADGVGGWPR